MKTIIELFETSVVRFSDNIYLWEKKNGEYRGTSYFKTREFVLNLASGLIEMGFEKGDRAALLSDGRNDWIISELGVLYAGGATVPLSVRLQKNELLFRLKHSECRYIIVSKQHASIIESLKNKLPNLEKVIYLDGKQDPEKMDVDYREIISNGSVYRAQNTDLLERTYKSIQPNELANISYTSGTTSDPKGIMLTHLNYASNVVQSNTLMELKEDWRTLALLPWDHAFAHTTCLYAFMYKGASIASVEVGNTPMETLKNIPINIKEVKPTLMMSVPAFSKNFRKNIESQIKKKGKRTEMLYNRALKIAYAYNGNGDNRGKGTRILLKPLVELFDKIIFKKIREGFGGNLKLFIGGGALLDTELQRFFYAIGIPVCQGYGLTEASPVISSNSLQHIKFGSSGKLVKYLDLKIVDGERKEVPIGQQGEIAIKGDNVMLGYWNNPEATKETIDNGWLYTGDMGYMTKDGWLYVLGRFKSLLISGDGEKYSPEGIEEALTEQSPYIQQVMLYNNQSNYTVGLVVPDIKAINRTLQRENIELGSDEAFERSTNIINSEIDEYKTGGKYETLFPDRWIPTTFAILPREFNVDDKTMNATMKIVRNKIIERYQEDIDYLFTSDAKNPNNQRNQNAIKIWNNL